MKRNLLVGLAATVLFGTLTLSSRLAFGQSELTAVDNKSATPKPAPLVLTANMFPTPAFPPPLAIPYKVLPEKINPPSG